MAITYGIPHATTRYIQLNSIRNSMETLPGYLFCLMSKLAGKIYVGYVEHLYPNVTINQFA